MNGILDVAIIGGGASGLCCAVSVKKKEPSFSVGIFEQLPRVGKKLSLTGNGRCNITNRNINISRYHGEDVSFAEYALNTYSADYTENFFENLGVVFVFEEDKAYPYSLQAASVVDALRFAAEECGVNTLCDTKITDITKQNGIFNIKSNGKVFKSKTVLLASGLYSGGENTGSNGSIFKLFKDKGYKTSATTPSIVQIKTDNKVTKSLKGIKINGNVTLLSNNKRIRSESGEILFCDYGLSGPPVMQLSRDVSGNDGKYTVSLDIMPEYSFNSLCDLITKRANLLKDRKLEEFFTGMLNKRVGQQILKQSGKVLSDKAENLKPSDIKNIANLIKNWQFSVTGTTGFNNSQVTAGGLKTISFSDKNMMSQTEKGLFAAGEILDIDGDCGGFNLQWAWSSGFCAADGIIEFLKKNDNNK